MNRSLTVLALALVTLLSCQAPFGAYNNPVDPDATISTRFQVTYNANAATSGTVPVDATFYSAGAKVTVLGNPGSLTKTGNSFAGWNTKADGSGTTYSSGQSFNIGSANVTLYALWSVLLTYTVTYNGNTATGGTVPVDANTYLTAATVTVLANSGSLVKTGNTFAGWNTKADGTGTSYAGGQTFTLGSASVTLFAVWTSLPTYTVTYNGNGATGGAVPSDANNYLAGATATVLANSGSMVRVVGGSTYSFAGWNTLANGTGTSYSGGQTLVIGSTNQTLFAVWTLLPTYTVTYNGGTGFTGGSPPTDSNNYLTGATATVLGNSGSLSKTGNSFAGWNTQANGSGTSYAAGSTFSMGSANVTLYAIWSPNSYTLTFNGNGGTTSGSATTYTQSLVYNVATALTANAFTNAGYLFGGWATSAALATAGTVAYADGANYTIGTSAVSLYAIWTPRGTVVASLSSVATSPRPEGLMWDGTNLWVSETNDQKVYKMSTAGANLSSISLGTASTHALAWDVVGTTFWGTDYWSQPPHLYKYAITGGTATQTITLATTLEYPTAMTLDRTSVTGGFWVVDTNSPGGVNPVVFTKLNTSGTQLAQWSLTGFTPTTAYGICMDYIDNTILWMSCSSTLYKVSLTNHTVLAQYAIGQGVSLLMGVAMVDATHFWMVAGNNGKIINVVIQ